MSSSITQQHVLIQQHIHMSLGSIEDVAIVARPRNDTGLGPAEWAVHGYGASFLPTSLLRRGAQ